MDRYLCIHGHFYQPPRENPWLEAIEIQDSAHPYHDWNERITAECCAPNSASRILDGEGHIMDIVSNYAKMSFNIGPTVLSWMEKYSPEIYQAILEADRMSIEWRSGHGSAIAQVYNHLIMPLANKRDKRTQVLWGIKDFEYRFKRFPEGMWLSETAVDIETLEVLAECGIKFTILAPHQALKVRKIGTGKWKDVSGGRIDPTRSYLCRLPSGRRINIFFYDGPISQAVAFERLLNKGEDFANRLLSGFSEVREWPQILNIATDGESYGHHHKFGDMALAYALNYIESNGIARLTNYGEHLEKQPPTHEAEIIENTSWSCMHGIERWRSNCGCNSGGHSDWNQEWRAPLREALDWLRDQLSFKFEHKAKEYLKDPLKAREEYIDIILDRSEENTGSFLERHSSRKLSIDEAVIVMQLMEMQRHAMLMYTSCGWFFDELSGIETTQVMQYAGRAIQLSEDLFGDGLEKSFLERLSNAKSNLPEHKDGGHIYEKFVKPAIIDLKKVGIHYAVSSLFKDYPERSEIYCYAIDREDYQDIHAGRMKLAVGRIRITSAITCKSEHISFSVLHFGDHSINGGVRNFLGDDAYQSMKHEIITAFESGDFADIIRLMDTHFGMHIYSLIDLFRDEQRKILGILIGKTLEEFESSYRQIYDNNRILMGFLQEAGIPIPKAFYTVAAFTLGLDLKKSFEGEIDTLKIQYIVDEIKKWKISIDFTDIEFTARHGIERLMDALYKNPSDVLLLHEVRKAIDALNSMPFEINLWYVQNIYYKLAKTVYKEYRVKAKFGDTDAAAWTDEFKNIGQGLFFNIGAVLPEGD